jgi:outer membrane receptor protein involved in Fe transport
MNSHRPLAGLRLLLLAPASILLASPMLWAQRAAPDAATLAKYDLNKNGQLDPSELTAMEADQAKAAAAVASEPASGKEVVELSPFQVNASDDRGYYASNTLSGTRINSKLEDLASSISVVTKQQMEDFALLDINDIFLYEASTEGTGNYTDAVVDRNGVVTDNVAGNPNNANRVRGIGPANQARGNFQTSGRVPLDPINVDAVEVSRGPNSNLFGLGNGAGTVNTIPSQANLNRERTSLELRFDNLGSSRVALDLNRPILKDRLAIRGSFLHQEDEFVRQPSFSRTNRYNGMVTFRPFKNTTLRGSFERYENYARRPNAILPRDGISYWKANGSPTWNAATWTVTRNGVDTVVPFNSNQGNESAALGAGLQSGGTGLYARPSMFVDRYGQIGLWMVGRRSGINTATPPIPTPDFQTGNERFVESAPAPRVGPLASTVSSITDKSIYDWTETNIAATNWNEDRVNNYTVELEQIFLNTPRNVLALQLGWNREDAKRYSRSFVGTSGESPMLVFVDVTRILPDGNTNPFFLRPYVNALEPTIRRDPLLRDIHRAQLAYQLKLSQEKSWLRWLGDHSFSGYAENKDTVNASYRFRDVIVDNHPWIPAGAQRANSVTAARVYYRFYLGDNQGQNIEYGSPAWEKPSGTHNFRWYNGTQWVNESAQLGEAYIPGTQRFANVIKTFGVITQNSVLDGRLVTTFGFREDSNFNRNFAPTGIMADGITPDYSTDDTSPNDWFRRDGKTKTTSFVAKPFRNWRSLDSRIERLGGLASIGAQFVRSLSFHYGTSDSFIPERTAQNLNLRLLPNPTSETEERGFSFAISDKLVVRFNMYETNQIDSRTGDAGTIATRAGRIDFAFGGNNDQFNLQRQATAWITVDNPGITPDALAIKVAEVMGVTPNQLALMNAYPIAETSDVASKGKELEIYYNPTRDWTMRINVAEQETVEQNVTPGIQDYIDARRPIWEKVIDTRNGGTSWFTTRYGSAGTAADFLASAVQAPYKLLRATEGKTKPQIRQWRVNAFSSIALKGVPVLRENKFVRNLSLSGAVRWEDKGALGYYAYANDPNAYDPNRPVYDSDHFYVDLGASYRTRLFNQKVGMRVQLNVRNALESGRLQAVGALPNGQPHTYRIVDPRLFILTASFDL